MVSGPAGPGKTTLAHELARTPGHPLLAGRAAVTLADLAGYPVVCLPAVLALVWKPGPGPAAREFLRCCRQAFPAGNPAAVARG